MRKAVCLGISLFLFILLLNLNASAVNSKEELFDDTENKLFSAIDSETADILEDLGISDLEFENIKNFSFRSIIDYFSDDFATKMQNVLKHTFLIASVIFIISIISLPSNRDDSDLIEYLSVSVIIALCFAGIFNIINVLVSVINASSDFLLSYIPIFAVLIAMSGNVASALSYNTLLLTTSEIISGFLSSLAERITGIYFALSIGFSLNKNINLSRFTSAFSRISSISIGLVSTLFVSLLTVKSVFSANVDTVSAKSVRFMISSFIPVVGGAISDAYSSLLGSIGIVKSSVAIVGIVVTLVINLPVLFEGLCFSLSYNFLSFTAEILNAKKVAEVLKSFSAGIRFLLLIEVFLMFILIISTAIMVNLKSSVLV